MFINSNIPLADSNVLISYLIQDQNFDQARRAISQGCYYNEFILCEVLNFIQNKYSYNFSIKAHQLISFNTNLFVFLPTNLALQIKAVKIRTKFQDNEFSFTDSIILAQADENGLVVFTNDKKMSNYEQVKVLDPNN